jgi:hypothetical protein
MELYIFSSIINGLIVGLRSRELMINIVPLVKKNKKHKVNKAKE